MALLPASPDNNLRQFALNLSNGTMEETLKDKMLFFEHLKSSLEDAGDDELADGEASHREKCRAFTLSSLTAVGPQTRSSQTRPASQSIKNAPGTAPRRTASDPIPKATVTQEVIVIEDTPEPRRRASKKASHSVETEVIEGTPIPDSARLSNPTRRTTHPLFKGRISRAQSVEETPSGKMPKRKREELLKLVPEAQQWFKELRFFYIPNNDINQKRRQQIKRAREYGATWTRELADATHVIVDKDLVYSDIERILTGTPALSEKIIVNELWPLDCLGYRTIVNPDQGQYKVSGIPGRPEVTMVEPESSVDSDHSLEVKKRHNDPSKWDYIPDPGTPTRSLDSSQPSAGLNAKVDGPLTRQNRHPSPAAPSSSNERRPQPEDDQQAGLEPSSLADEEAVVSLRPIFGDELDKIIGIVQEKFSDISPELVMDDDDDDDDGHSALGVGDAGADSADEDGSSEEERHKKRQRLAKTKAKATTNQETWQDNYQCMKGGTGVVDEAGPNARVVELLEKMLDIHAAFSDRWRVFSYRKAIGTLRQLKWKVRTYEEAMQLPKVGHRIASKIEEIVLKDSFAQLEYAQQEPMTKVLELFQKIYGVGQAQAHKWIAQGFRTLEDLEEKAKLSTNQRVGIDHFDDLNTRIPRCEVEALGACVRRVAATIDPKVELLIGGSYRRGSESSGDIDFIITKNGTSSSDELVPFLDKLVHSLQDDGFLTATLAALSHNAKKGLGSKWHGCCVLPKADFPGEQADYRPIWRRIDLLLVPESEFGAALIYFTGNDIFNRSMRHLASMKGMRLNQRGLYKDVMRGPGRVKYTEGVLVEGRDEKKIFEILGVKWREPHERWC